MLYRAISFAFVALPVLTAAVVIPQDYICNTGNIQCCKDTIKSSSENITAVFTGLLGATLADIEGLIGLYCSRVSSLGDGGVTCAQPLCCAHADGSTSGGIIALGCTPIKPNV